MRKLLLVIILIGLIAGVWILNEKRTHSQQSPDPSTQPTPSATQIPGDWQTYRSNEWNFTIKHPVDLEIQNTEEGAHFFKLGETQATGTELYDGLSLLIFSAPLHEKTFMQFVKEEYEKTKSEPVTESISEIKEVTVAGEKGGSFTVTSLGTRTVIFLPKGETEYVKITNNTVEPGNVKRNFQKTVKQMIETLEF